MPDRNVTLEYLAGQLDMVLRNLDESKDDQGKRWGKQDDANSEIHRRLDEFIGQKYVTLSECENRCRGRIADKQWFVYTAIVCITELVNVISAHWHNILTMVLGGRG